MVLSWKGEVRDYPGLATDPFTWEDAVQKFDTLVAGRVDEGLAAEIKDAATLDGKHPSQGPHEAARLCQGRPKDGIVIESSLRNSEDRSQKKGERVKWQLHRKVFAKSLKD
jgi:hypothetical protein